MKRIPQLILGLAALAVAAQASAQASRNVPLTVYVPEQAEYLPEIAHAAMANKMRQVVNLNGMGATDDRGQFYITCTVSVTDKEVVGTEIEWSTHFWIAPCILTLATQSMSLAVALW